MRDARALGAAAATMLEQLAAITEPGPGVTRIYLTPEHRRAIDLVSTWMREARLEPRIDAVANLCGRPLGLAPEEPVLVLGSHIDTVRQGGAYDGALGVVLPLMVLRELHATGTPPRLPVEVVAFGDEENIRFPIALTGSRALTGDLEADCLDRTDAQGVSLREALARFGVPPAPVLAAARPPASLRGYLEIHIEQGPVLEQEGRAVGVVTAIVHSTRFRVRFEGEAGHAGTVPMGQRRDALCAAAEAILAVERVCAERSGRVGTVGIVQASPGAPNVIPGAAELSLDLRAPDEAAHAAQVAAVREALEAIAARRGLGFEMLMTNAGPGCAMSEVLSSRLAEAVAACGLPVRKLPSGAGHDAAAFARVTDAAMLFVRCRGGISHNPVEHADVADIGAAASVLGEFLRRL